MSRHENFSSTDMSSKDMVLATDLDGTFLGGSDEARAKFYEWIEANRERVGLIFVTGRDPGFIHSMTRKSSVPRPDYVVGDVGTTIASVDDTHLLSPLAELEAEITESWNYANDRVQAALRNVRGLKLQPGAFRHRVSYDLDPDTFDNRALDVVAELGFDALISDNRYFDVLPKGVSKGPSLLKLLTALNVENSRCLVAGDTLNDLSMLALGLPAVAVGGSEEALLKEVADFDHVFQAEGIGVAGIAEAIMHFGLLQQK